MVAGESAPATELRSSTVASLIGSPSAVSRATAPSVSCSGPPVSRPGSICRTSRSVGSRSRTDSTAAAWSSVSTTQATAPESPRIQEICSGELVS